ncbi:hypothetical protein NESM_000268000 [Novymonas esmeraldas]|uniref:Uncharacterized protein n=1 Tax=Novymonas esmeraldas TaxID=1808958 RepID=A0AAW0F7J0_9TRYP
MPSPYVCILHSSSGSYTDDLVGNALQCLSAMQRSVRAGAPDFVPAIAVYFADPHTGTNCVFSSALPDSNHAMEDRVGGVCPALADSTGSVFQTEEGEEGPRATGAAERTVAFAQLFRFRSPRLLQQAVLRAAQEYNTRASSAAAAPRPVSGKSTETPPTAALESPLPEAPNVWGSLAGALLAALCFLRAHSSSAFHVAAAESTEDEPDVASSSLPRSAGGILVFSDARAPAPPTYSAECAFAVAAVTASKMGVTVSCFGDAVLDADASESRLVAVASSLGGCCAARFTLPDLGYVLDGASAAAGVVGRHARQKRDRIASQYVVAPAMLPQVPRCEPPPPLDSSAAASLEDFAVSGKRARTESAAGGAVPDGVGKERCSYLGWLCPSCMAVIYRGPTELTDTAASDPSAEDGGVADHTAAPSCPYCCLA